MRSIVILLGLLTVMCSRTDAQSYTGTYRTKDDEGHVLTLMQAADGAVTGTDSTGGTSLEIKAKIENGRVVGIATLVGAPIKFRITISRMDGMLIQQMTEEGPDGQPDPSTTVKLSYILKAGAPKDPGPPAKPAGTLPPPRKTPVHPAIPPANGGKVDPTPPRRPTTEQSSPDVAGWSVLRHPIGLSIRFPKTWTIKESPELNGYQLTPPNASDKEVYILSGISADGVQSAADPRVVAALGNIMMKIAPALRRVGEVEQVKTASEPGIALTWEGGENARARSYVVILKNTVIGLTAIGLKPKIEPRDPILRKMFTSFGQNEGQHDARLVGIWNRMGTTSVDARDNVGRLQASSVGDHRRLIQLLPDGTCVSKEIDRTIAIGQGVSIDTGDQATIKRGKWFGGDNRLVLMWEKDAEEYAYRLTEGGGARQLVFILGNGKGLVWQPAQ